MFREVTLHWTPGSFLLTVLSHSPLAGPTLPLGVKPCSLPVLEPHTGYPWGHPPWGWHSLGRGALKEVKGRQGPSSEPHHSVLQGTRCPGAKGKSWMMQWGEKWGNVHSHYSSDMQETQQICFFIFFPKLIWSPFISPYSLGWRGKKGVYSGWTPSSIHSLVILKLLVKNTVKNTVGCF